MSSLYDSVPLSAYSIPTIIDVDKVQKKDMRKRTSYQL